jgi:hypothetical protein
MLGVAVACDTTEAHSRTGAAPRRVVTHVAQVVRMAEPEAFLAPVRLAPLARGAVVLDAAQRAVVPWPTLGAATGVAGDALGPAPAHVTARDGEVSVLDPRASRIVRVAGMRVVGRVPVAHAGEAFAACAMGHGQWLVLTADPDSALVAVNAAGQVTWRRPLPWPEAQQRSALGRQGMLVPADTGCVLVMAFGPGWAWVQPNGRMSTVVPLLDTGRPPTVRVRRGVARLIAPVMTAADAAVLGDTVLVLATGPRAHGRLLDRYHLRTGAYLGSVQLPGSAAAIAWSPSGLTVVAQHTEGPRLALLRLMPAGQDKTLGMGNQGVIR